MVLISIIYLIPYARFNLMDENSATSSVGSLDEIPSSYIEIQSSHVENVVTESSSEVAIVDSSSSGADDAFSSHSSIESLTNENDTNSTNE
jgi:hypothetical protein